MGKRLAGFFLTVFFYFKVFGVKKGKTILFKEKMVLRVVFIKLTFRWLQTGRSDLKSTKTIENLLMVHFLPIFKNVTFFKIFQDS